MRQALIALDCGNVLFALGEHGCDGSWIVTPDDARSAADRLAATAQAGGGLAELWPDADGVVGFHGVAEALQRLAEAMRRVADIAEAKTAVKQ
jgi:hypothetical protein